jgi:hypothetical protein
MRKVKLADGLVHDAYDTKFPHWCDTVCDQQDWVQGGDAGEATEDPVDCLACIAGMLK